MCPELLALLGPQRPLDVGVQLIEERIEFLSRARPEFVQPNGAALERRPHLALLLRRQFQIACDARRGVGRRRRPAGRAVPPPWSEPRQEDSRAQAAAEDHDHENHEP